MMGPGNRGAAPPIAILWAIRHAVAAEQFEAAGRRAHDDRLIAAAGTQRGLVREWLHQAAIFA